MAYLDDNEPARSQFREPRREAQSGIVFVHSAESLMDTVGIDTGAENVGGFITRRSDPGSYHCIVDSDSAIDLVRDECEAFQIGANGHNRHGWGISFACRTTDLDPAHWWTRKAMVFAGQKIAAYWIRRGIDPRQAARWLSRRDADARRGPGLATHGLVQPGDRTDAWAVHPQREALERMLVEHILAAVPSNPHLPFRSDNMRRHVNTDGRVELIDLSPEGVVVTKFQGLNGTLGDWVPVTATQPSSFTSLESYQADDGRLVAIANNEFGVPFISAQPEPSAGPWTDWVPYGELLEWLAAQPAQ